MALLRGFCVALALLLLAACSSSGDGNNTVAVVAIGDVGDVGDGGDGDGGDGGDGGGKTIVTGQFVDSAVSGIRYETETLAGITDNQGQFEYVDGETVSFYIGDVLLGDASGASVISLFDLVDGVTPVVGRALEKAVLDRDRGPGFTTVINLATLLQTLDSDGNLDNGIEISAEMTDLFASLNVDFDQNWRDFSHDRAFRQVLTEAKVLGLVDAERKIRKPWRAMEHLYTSLNISDQPVALITKRSEHDSQISRATTVSRYEYDIDGFLILQESSSEEYGKIRESKSTFDYDADGNLILAEYDYYGDGTIDSRRSEAYNSDGTRILQTLDSNADGIVDGSTTFNDDGKGLRFDSYGNLDGILTSTWIYFYDAQGRAIREEQDRDADGITDYSNTYSYDANGLVSRHLSSHYFRGEASHSTYTYTYDAGGNRIREEFDRYEDGELDHIRTYTYDANGNLIREVRDLNADGAPDMIDSYTYDANSKLVYQTSDPDGDGTPRSAYSYTYDGKGNLTGDERDYNLDGFADYTTALTYAEDGNLMQVVSYARTGNNDFMMTLTYDKNVNGWWWVFSDHVTFLGNP